MIIYYLGKNIKDCDEKVKFYLIDEHEDELGDKDVVPVDVQVIIWISIAVAGVGAIFRNSSLAVDWTLKQLRSQSKTFSCMMWPP